MAPSAGSASTQAGILGLCVSWRSSGLAPSITNTKSAEQSRRAVVARHGKFRRAPALEQRVRLSPAAARHDAPPRARHWTATAAAGLSAGEHAGGFVPRTFHEK